WHRPVPITQKQLNAVSAPEKRVDTRHVQATFGNLNDSNLLVDISDALSERDIHKDNSEFIWLHDVLEGNEDYLGYIIPPPRPDFDASREKLQKLGDGEGTMTKEEFKNRSLKRNT
ncbi:sorting nexin-6-like isoform X1, partial [Dinothrombium tinctorium]